jgi:N-acetylglucosaminyl-diphospho-decaprenol L-rhamnosyltransferase
MSKTAVIIVCYNNQNVLEKAVASLKKQTLAPKAVLIADSGSKDVSYLSYYQSLFGVHAFKAGDKVGFCVANNAAYHLLPEGVEYVLFQNPDCFLTETFIEEAEKWMEIHPGSGALTGTLKGYDLEKNAPSGTLDSTGIFRTWYGRWYDRGQGKQESFLGTLKKTPPQALCGALFFGRKKALDAVKLPNGDIFDRSFYMYKEDIDLSLRLKKAGYTLHYEPNLVAFHCRGWKKRSAMPKEMRLFSARNEQTIHRKYGFIIPFLYSSCKLAVVKYWNY